jgi:hypothetical protein
MLVKKRVIFCCAVLLTVVARVADAQEQVVVRGHFEADQAGIGEVIPYSLTARYPRNLQVLFPDSAFSFAPFEIRKKTYFQTRTTGDTSYDSAVYFLTTFEIDSIQRLQLPVYVLQARDCVSVVPRPDSIRLQYLVASVPDSVSTEKLPLKTNTAYQKVQWLLNYPVAAGIILALLVISGTVWAIFGKRIRRFFLLRRLKRDYQAFAASFGNSLDRLSSEFTSRKAEETLVLWKGYMENLEKFPYTKSTSKEIVRAASDQTLQQALQAIDGSIYGGRISSVDEFRRLQNFSQLRFQKKEEEVMNG